MLRRFSIVFTLVALAALLLAACAVQQEQPEEEAAEEAGAEEIAEPSPEQIQAEGCPEGQISNEGGTECMPLEQAERNQEQIEQAAEEFQRQQAPEQIGRYEAGELEHNQTAHVECQIAKAYLDGGQARVDEIQNPVLERLEEQFDTVMQDIEAKRKPEKQEGPTLREVFASAGYDCTAPEDLPAPPTPAELDKKYEKPADNPKQREVQCGPQSNASPEFREKYC